MVTLVLPSSSHSWLPQPRPARLSGSPYGGLTLMCPSQGRLGGRRASQGWRLRPRLRHSLTACPGQHHTDIDPRLLLLLLNREKDAAETHKTGMWWWGVRTTQPTLDQVTSTPHKTTRVLWWHDCQDTHIVVLEVEMIQHYCTHIV